nr:LCP family protein [Actinomycetota bacterium]
SSDGGPPGDEPGTAAGDARPPRVLTRVGKVALMALVVLLFVTIGVGWGAKSWLDAKLRSVVALDPNSESIVDKAGQHGDENYLLVGSDSRAGSSDADEVGSENGPPGARADTVMVAHIPAKRDRMVLVSFPRGLEVDRPGCDRWDPSTTTYPGGTAPAQRNVKLNSAYEIGGPRCVTKVVQRLTGLSINHFTAIDFAGFKEMVDSLAGVPICLDRPVVDSVLGQVVPTSGETVLAGDQALAFVRARHVRGDPTSEYGRIQRQQRVLTALLRKGLSEQVLSSPSKLRAFITAFGNYTLSDNTGLDELTTLGGSLRTIAPANVTFVTPPTQGEPDQDGNEVLRKNDTDALFAAIRANRPLPSAAARAPSTDDTRAVSPSDTTTPNRVTLAVRNGSSQAGLANQVADNLRSVGFKVSKVSNKVSKVGDTEASPRTVIRHSPDRAEQAATLAAAVPTAVTQETPGPAGLLELVLGNGFDGEVKAPVSADRGSSSTPPANLSTVNAADATCR